MHLNINFFLLCGELAKNILFWRFLKHILKNNLVKSSVWEPTYLSTNPSRSVRSSRRQIKVYLSIYISHLVFLTGIPPHLLQWIFTEFETHETKPDYTVRGISYSIYFFDNEHEIIDR